MFAGAVGGCFPIRALCVGCFQVASNNEERLEIYPTTGRDKQHIPRECPQNAGSIEHSPEWTCAFATPGVESAGSTRASSPTRPGSRAPARV